MHDVVHKILTAAEWKLLQKTGRFDGSADDLRDGFVHLSTTGQVPGTIERHFAGQSRLVLVAFRTVDLGANLRWEPSRGGQLFPHLYGPLLLTAVAGHQACLPGCPALSEKPDQPA